MNSNNYAKVLSPVERCVTFLIKDNKVLLGQRKGEEIGDNLYVGICKNISNRLNEHNRGKNRYTKGLWPWKVVYTEEFVDCNSAREKEKYYNAWKHRLETLSQNIRSLYEKCKIKIYSIEMVLLMLDELIDG